MKKMLHIFFLALSILLPFVAGIIVTLNQWWANVIAVSIVLLAILALLIAERLSTNIIGIGTQKITVSSEEPKNPDIGDLWVSI